MSIIAVGNMTSKGRITIPKEIRDYLFLRPGLKVEFHVDRQGHVIVRPAKIDIRKLRGMVRCR